MSSHPVMNDAVLKCSSSNVAPTASPLIIESKSSCNTTAVIFGALFVIFLIITCCLVVAWAIYSNGFQNLSATHGHDDAKSNASGDRERDTTPSHEQPKATTAYPETTTHGHDHGAGGQDHEHPATTQKPAVTARPPPGITMAPPQPPTTAKPPPATPPPPTTTAAPPLMEVPDGVSRMPTIPLHEEPFTRRVCTTEACVTAAATLIYNMDDSVSPCDDFYLYTCGGYETMRQIPPESDGITILRDMDAIIDLKLKRVIEEPITEDEWKPTRMVKTLYQSCMNREAASELDNRPLLELFESLGGWSLLPATMEGQRNRRHDDADVGRDRWTELEKAVPRFGVEGIVGAYVGSDLEDSFRRIITFYQPSLQLMQPRYYLEGEEYNLIRVQFLTYMVETLVSHGANRTEAEERAVRMLEFDMLLANITIHNPAGSRNFSSAINKMTLGEFKDKYGDIIDWTDYLKFMEPMVKFDNEMIINVESVWFYSQLAPVLHEAAEETLIDQIMFKVLRKFNGLLAPNYQEPYEVYRMERTGVDQNPLLYKECLGTATRYLQWPTSALYAKAEFQLETKQEAVHMIEYLRLAFEKSVKEADWIDDETKVGTLEKLEKMGLHIGYPDYLYNETVIMEPFVDTVLTNVTYFDNVITLLQQVWKYDLKGYDELINKDEWVIQIAQVNAFYMMTYNKIVFPAGILQPPFFALGVPRYLNFGSAGMAIGHELTHGYDDQGSQYNPDGNLVNWWDDATQARFDEGKQCFIEQYGNVTEPITGLNLNGHVTIGENIADNGGLRFGYLAYQLWEDINGVEPAMAAFENYTANQMFFIAFGNTWCSKHRPETIKLLIEGESHTLGHHRVNVPLRNMKEFAEAFSCPAGSGMNPASEAHTCEIW